MIVGMLYKIFLKKFIGFVYTAKKDQIQGACHAHETS